MIADALSPAFAAPASAPEAASQAADLTDQVLATFKRAQALGRYGHAQCVRMTAELHELAEEVVLAIVPPRTASR